ncbi:oxidoreductase [Pendulispora brunnea]|uniref:Oxidoreductase n=1 Tax=Pendulispora brunnea TaxID=2905690 RepID=A0ABZ2K9T2_9BACT
MTHDTPIWFITGCSSGFGHEIAKLVLARGGRAVLTARRPEQLGALVKEHGSRALALPLDVTDRAQIDRAVTAAEEHFGRVDVLVNNAGYGYLAAIEEGEDDAVRAQFETNVFGLVATIQRVLPGMRARRRGHIVNFSSLGGLVAFAATGYYHATKFAVEALSESLAQEVAPLGIKVTIVEPGAFRTEWASKSLRESSIVLDDYAATAGKRRGSTRASGGKQPGDPARGAAAVLAAVDAETPPLRLLLGASALQMAHQRLDVLRGQFDAWRDTSLSVDYPAP